VTLPVAMLEPMLASAELPLLAEAIILQTCRFLAAEELLFFIILSGSADSLCRSGL
jgi:hypothetical protein